MLVAWNQLLLAEITKLESILKPQQWLNLSLSFHSLGSFSWHCHPCKVRPHCFVIILKGFLGNLHLHFLPPFHVKQIFVFFDCSYQVLQFWIPSAILHLTLFNRKLAKDRVVMWQATPSPEWGNYNKILYNLRKKLANHIAHTLVVWLTSQSTSQVAFWLTSQPTDFSKKGKKNSNSIYSTWSRHMVATVNQIDQGTNSKTNDQ